MKKLTVKDFAFNFKIPETTLRGWISRDELTTSSEIIKNRKTRIVLLDEKAQKKINEYRGVATSENEFNYETITHNETRNEYTTGHNADKSNVQDAEIITDSTHFQMISMEQSSFDQLITSIKELAEAKSQSDNEAIKRIENEYFELKTKFTHLDEENKKLFKEIALAEAEIKIKEMRIKELEEKTKSLEEYFTSHKEKNKLWEILNISGKL